MMTDKQIYWTILMPYKMAVILGVIALGVYIHS